MELNGDIALGLSFDIAQPNLCSLLAQISLLLCLKQVPSSEILFLSVLLCIETMSPFYYEASSILAIFIKDIFISSVYLLLPSLSLFYLSPSSIFPSFTSTRAIVASFFRAISAFRISIPFLE